MPDNYIAFEISSLLAGLNEEDYSHALSYIRFLYDKRKTANTIKQAFKDIQELIEDNKGWDSEEEMIKDTAEFRRSRRKRKNTPKSVSPVYFWLCPVTAYSALPAQPRTSISLCLTISLMLARAGFRYWRGSK